MHYKDGTEAKVGDLVKGTVYNTKGVIVGVMIGITAGSSACNCRVALVQQRGIGQLSLPIGDAQGTPHLHEVRTSDGAFLVHREGYGMRDGQLYQGDVSLVGVKIDYSQCDHLELVHRPE